MMFDETLVERASLLLQAFRARNLLLATAESCTGGLLIGLLTEVAGSSSVVDRGFVTYSNDAKHAMLGVPLGTLDTHGAVSAQTAEAMAVGALSHSRAGVAIAITGIAGPGGETPTKPVGLVHFGLAVRLGATSTLERRFGDIGRGKVRLAAMAEALSLLEAVAAASP